MNDAENLFVLYNGERRGAGSTDVLYLLLNRRGELTA
jgi:hypothetical protein